MRNLLCAYNPINVFSNPKTQPVESETRTYQGRVGSGRTAGRRGGAGQDADRTVRPGDKRPAYPPRHRKTNVLNVSPEARTSEILCKPMEEHNDRLTSGLSAGREALFIPGCSPVDRCLFVSVNPFHARHIREQGTCGFWKPDNLPAATQNAAKRICKDNTLAFIFSQLLN